MKGFETMRIATAQREQAPDGSGVFPLLSMPGGGVALFELDRNQVSRAVRHRTVNEIWLVLEGRGSMWRQQDGCEEIAPLEEGVCVSIPAGTAFQFRCDGSDGLRVVAVTMPPWPGDEEAELVPGKW